MKKSILLYPLIIGFFACLIWFVIDKGKYLAPKSEQAIVQDLSMNKILEKSKPVVISSNESVGKQFLNNIKSPLGLLLLQIITILFVSKLFGIIFSKFGQQMVVGEMIAGIFLGPSD